jgi:outer membrane protein, heavy metal efflux system
LQRAPADNDAKARLNIPPVIPGSEAKIIDLPKTDVEKLQEVKRIYPELSNLPEEPHPLPGPHGHPYTLDDLQRLAAANSPQLREAAFDVVTAEGNLIQAAAYPNPTAYFEATPSNNGSTSAVWGAGVDQTIVVSGKIKLAVASAQLSLDNAKLALKRARSDLATAVRNAYFALLVAKETVHVTKGLAQFTDEIYRVFEKYLEGGQCAAYEPAALRAQAYSARLAYRQAIQSYIYSWEQLVAIIGMRQLPLTEVAGRIDAFIPYFDYDVVKAHVLCHHSDIKVAYNGIEIARYNLKLAQVTPIPNIDVQFLVNKEFALVPFNWVSTVQLSMPIPIWDQNKGNILAAQGSLGHAEDEPHRVEVTLTNTLATAYGNYKTNLEALEYYRRFILPDQVVFYRGVFARRSVDMNAAFSDLVGAQQALATSVTAYLATLGTLWTSVVSVADLLQTDDLFQLAKPMEVAPIPDLLHMPPFPCAHPCAPPGAGMMIEPPAHIPEVVKPPAGPSQLPELLPPPTAPPVKTSWTPSTPSSFGLMPVHYQRSASPPELLEPPPPIVRTSPQTSP